MYPSDFARCSICFEPLPEGGICPDPLCESDQNERSLADLPANAVLQSQYRIGRVLGRGGFGITYLAWDERLSRRTAVKECFPQGLVRRSRDQHTVQAISDGSRKQFDTVRELFVREARVLAHFQDQPGIVAALSVFDEHNTAYLVMEFLKGQTLKQFLESQPENRVSFEEAYHMLSPVLSALVAVHEQQWLHRDISPDNIFLTARGQVKLLDFGAARYAAGQQTRSLPVVLKEGYAPAEQYASKGQQGTWTDVYAVAATVYRTITGHVPPPALDRLEEDELRPASDYAQVPPELDRTLASALEIKMVNRTRTVAEFARQIEMAWRSLGGPSIAPPVPRDSWPSPLAPEPRTPSEPIFEPVFDPPVEEESDDIPPADVLRPADAYADVHAHAIEPPPIDEGFDEPPPSRVDTVEQSPWDAAPFQQEGEASPSQAVNPSASALFDRDGFQTVGEPAPSTSSRSPRIWLAAIAASLVFFAVWFATLRGPAAPVPTTDVPPPVETVPPPSPVEISPPPATTPQPTPAGPSAQERAKTVQPRVAPPAPVQQLPEGTIPVKAEPSPQPPPPQPPPPQPPPPDNSARVTQLLASAAKNEQAQNLPAALRDYEDVRSLSPEMRGVAETAISRIQAQMLKIGSEAMKNAKQYDALGRIDDAIKAYDVAAQNLPDGPDKLQATDRLRVLRAGRSR